MKNTGKREKNPELNRGGRMVALILAFLVVLAILPQVRQESGASSAEPAQSGAVPTVQTEPVETKPEAPRFTVCLDPGHGGNDSGCVSGKRHESDDALTMAKLVKQYLEQENVQVVLTRTKDKYVELSERAKCANQANADYFVSIHRNLNPLGCGVETWTRANYSEESDALAKAIQKRLVKVGVQQDRGVKHGTQESASSSYYVLRKTKMPGVLIELGFIDNQKDNQLLDKHKKAYAKAIAKGIIQTYEKYHGEQANRAQANTKSK